MEEIMEDDEYTSTDAAFDAKDILDGICELEEGAFEFLLNNPGCNKRRFIKGIMNEHWDKIRDVYGFSLEPVKISASVLKLWDTPYYDAQSVQEHTFKEWAMMFSTKENVDEFKRHYKIY